MGKGEGGMSEPGERRGGEELRCALWLVCAGLFLVYAGMETVWGEDLKHALRKEGTLEKAGDYLERRQYEEALKELDALGPRYEDDYELQKGRANVYFAMRDWQQAAEAYGKLMTRAMDREHVIRHYLSRMGAVEDDSVQVSLLKEEMKERAVFFFEKKEDREEALSVAFELYSMADTGTLALQPFREALVREFPHSEAAYGIIVNDFYDGIYPIWRSDTARTAYCEEFLERYPETEWRCTVYQYLLSSLHRLKEYERVREVGKRFVAEEENPFAYGYVAHLLVEEEAGIEQAVQYAKRAITLWYTYEKPLHLAREQWALERKALFGDTRMSLARALMLQGNYPEAERWIRAAIDSTGFGVNDYRTGAAYHCVQGRILEKQAREEEAVRSYVRCLVEGDVNNRWSARADSALMDRIGGEGVARDVVWMVREQMGYEGICFEDVTEAMGFKDIKASRIAWGDYNGDGYDDLLLNGSRIFENLRGAGFVEVTDAAGIEGYGGSGGIWGDWNNDGMLDFFTISGGEGVKGDRLWLQQEGGVFRDVTDEAGGVRNGFSTEGAAWGDADGDGFLELYLANYENRAEHSYYPDGYYRCRNGTWFEEVLNEVGMVPPFNENRAGRGVNWGDFDNDGDADIYVSNYRLQENFLWRNNGDGTFTNVASLRGVAGDEVDGWWGHTIGASWADYDNDGDLDLITANLAHPRYIEFSNKTRLYENLGPPEWNFVDRREAAGIKFEETHSDPAWADIDNDGDLDLYLTCVYEGRRSFLYENLGDGTFRDITMLAGVRVFNGWGCAFSDFDGDGDMDLFVASGSGVHLFENGGNDNHYLRIKVKGKRTNSRGVGARITVSQGGRVQIREVQGGKGTTSQNSSIQHFGFGDDRSPASVEVRFSNGKRVVRRQVSLDGFVEIIEE